MKVRLAPLDLTDQVRGAIRARDGRYGKASRKEARAFLDLAIRTAIERLPPPKVRAPKTRDVERASFTVQSPKDVAGVRARVRSIAKCYAGGAR